ncbi:MAG: 3-methyl-2-oxobutanoate hydroxymethyltransferase [Desulfobacterota bacterium]|nr:3-methyl-2-oxobutanoate hydroxymethyltransferase [Thermodesulfobacteriota bacterium]
MKKTTVLDIQRMKQEQKKIVMLTAYDYPFARMLDECGIDILLVGDSLGNVVLGFENTLPVTMADMEHHVRAVRRGCKQALLVADLPFLSYQVSPEDAKRNAGILIKHTGAEAVKLEGGENMASIIRALTLIDIPVMAHIGLTPQSIHRMGGYKVQGKQEAQRQKLLADAAAVEHAGAFAVVLECVPASLAKEITQLLSIPTIGIGAGPHCDGQVLVIHDLLGLSGKFRPKFIKQYAQLEDIIKQAVTAFISDVRSGTFPDKEHSFT